MSFAYTVYQTSDGKILLDTEAEDGVTPTLSGGQAYILGAYDGRDFYVSGGVATPRPALIEDGSDVVIPADNSTTTLIASMPIGTMVVQGSDVRTSTVVEALQVRGVISGKFEFSIIPPFPYQDATVTVIIDAV